MSDPTPPPSRRPPAEGPRDDWADLRGSSTEHPFTGPARTSARRVLRGLVAGLAAAVAAITFLHRQGVWTTPAAEPAPAVTADPLPGPTGGGGPVLGGGGAAPSGSAAHTVVFELTGEGPASVLYWVEGGTPQNVETRRLPWRAELGAAAGVGATMLASRERGGGTIRCRLLVDGVERARDTAGGAVPVADCSARMTG
ncbi:MmpS family transport accessory protein [Micromonospora mirobrigensis]|uniref:Membrane protein n=1 Tax=Micromonospora mirobrigensis TaxID=262898 RepID=A0A1C4Y4K2_9ACTN|nr:MmpS family transport accessory protein [Micromonospora mirobrigensis]SCF15629.1 membrane protein [Micromonospora mirobrigensis]